MANKRVSIDAGHGMSTPGKRTPLLTSDLYIDGKLVKKKGQCIHEFEWNMAVAKYLGEALQRNGIDVKFVNDMTGKIDTALSTRASLSNAWKADAHISCHYNAYGSCSKFLDKSGGLLVLRTANCSSNSIKLGELVASQLKKDITTYKYSWGLMKDVDMSGFTLGILRQTNCPAILIEFGFMDVLREAKLMLDPKHQKVCAESTCKAICAYFGITYKAQIVKSTPSFKKYAVRIVCDSLNGRVGAGTEFNIIEKLTKGEAVTIVSEKKLSDGSKWGKTLSGYWINLSDKYVQFVKYM